MSLIALLFSVHTAHSAGGCLGSFAANLSRISYGLSSLSKACKAEVLKGESNSDRIASTCTQEELTKVMVIRDNRDANRSLCQQNGCETELKAAKVCVKGQSLQYYLNQVRKR